MSIFMQTEVDNINKYQDCGQFHPLTCTCGDHIKLRATIDGLVCPCCERVQKWCPDFIKSGEYIYAKK